MMMTMMMTYHKSNESVCDSVQSCNLETRSSHVLGCISSEIERVKMMSCHYKMSYYIKSLLSDVWDETVKGKVLINFFAPMPFSWSRNGARCLVVGTDAPGGGYPLNILPQILIYGSEGPEGGGGEGNLGSNHSHFLFLQFSLFSILRCL